MLRDREYMDIYLTLSVLHSNGKIITVLINSHRIILDSYLEYGYDK